MPFLSAPAAASIHARLRVYGFELPAVRPFFEEYVAQQGLVDRVGFRCG